MDARLTARRIYSNTNAIKKACPCVSLRTIRAWVFSRGSSRIIQQELGTSVAKLISRRHQLAGVL